MKNITIKLLASIVLLIVFSHGRQRVAFGQNQQSQSIITVTIPSIGLTGPINAFGYSGGISAAIPPSTTPTLQDFSFTKGIDQATPILAQRVAVGSRIDSVTVDVYSVDPNTQIESPLPYLEITMTHVRVTGSTLTVDTSKSLSSPVEQVTLCYGAINYAYRFPHQINNYSYDRGSINC
jgi:type VI protein secretion system component Hcp